jgi:DNA-directed RNA polymerase subunit beta'
MYRTPNSWKIRCHSSDGPICYGIDLLSSPQIQEISGGEIVKPEIFSENESKKCDRPIFTKGGLFCEDIFGDIADYSCQCGIMGYSCDRADRKLLATSPSNVLLRTIFNDEDPSRIEAHSGNKCKVCSDVIIPIQERLNRWGHIKLAAPVVHIWFLKNRPSNLSAILGIPLRYIEEVLSFKKYIVTDSTDSSIPIGRLFSESAYRRAIERVGDKFKVNIGAEAIKYLLDRVDFEKIVLEIGNEIIKSSSKDKKRKLDNRLQIIEAYLQSGCNAGNIVLESIPVTPLDLRFLSYKKNVSYKKMIYRYDAINVSYLRVINRNNRLKRLIELGAPDIIVRNEKQMLQEAVDFLFDKDSRKFSFLAEEDDKAEPNASLSSYLKFFVDDDPFQNDIVKLNQRQKQSKNVRHLVSKVLWQATWKKSSGKEELFDIMINKLRGLCIRVNKRVC